MQESGPVQDAEVAPSSRAKARSAPVIPASNPFLQLFWQLAEEAPQQRQQAQESLLAALHAEQTQGQLLPVTSSVAPNLLYAVKRLFRGLCSSRGRAREGFAAALAAVLTAFPAVPSDVLRSALAASTSPPSAPSRQELTDFKLGYAQAVRCICTAGRAGLWSEEGEVATLSVVQRLLGYASSKTVREAAYCAVRDLMAAVSWDEYERRLEPAVLADMASVKRETEEEVGLEDGDGGQGRGGAQELKQRKRKKARREQPAEAEAPLIQLRQLTAEQLLLLLSMHSLYQQHDRPLQSLAAHLAPSALSPLSPAGFPHLVEMLASTSYSLPSLHSAYAEVFSRLLSSSSSSSDWSSLYSLLAEHLFAERASTARKHQGLLLLQHLLTLLPGSPLLSSASGVSCLLHPLLLRSLSNSLSSPSTHLHDEAKAVQAALLRAAEAERSIALPVLDRVLGSNARWDAVTKSRTVQRLVQLLRKDDLHAHIAALIRSFTADEGSQQPAEAGAAEEREKRQLWCLEQLCGATRHSALLDPSAAVDSASTEAVLRFLVLHSFFDASQPPPPAARAKGKPKRKAPAGGKEAVKAVVSDHQQLTSPLTQRVRAVCQTRLWSLLDDLLPRPPVKLTPEEQKRRLKEEKRRKRASAAVDAQAGQEDADAETETDEKEEPKLWSLKALQYLSEVEHSGYALVRPLTAEGREARQAMLLAVQEMEERREAVRVRLAEQTEQQEAKKARERLKKERALSLLMLHLGLLQLVEEGSVTSLLQELQVGCQQFSRQTADESGAGQPAGTAKSRGGTRRAAVVLEDAGAAEAASPQPAFIESLVDILLSLLVRRSSLVRSIARLVFVAFASDVTEAALQDVLRVVKTKAAGSEKKEAEDDDDFAPFDVDDDAEDADVEEAEEQPEKDGPQVSSSVRSKRKRVTAEAEQQQQAGSDESSDDEPVALESLDGLLSAPLTAAEQAAVDAASSMEQYDHQLSNILRLRQAGRKEQQADLQAQQVDFQLRVMDLLDVFVRCEARSRLLLQPMMEAAADAVAVTRKAEKLKGLHERLVALMQRMARSKEHPAIIFPVEKSNEQDTAAGKRRQGKRKAEVEQQPPAGQEAEVGRYALTVGRLQQLMTALMGRAMRAADSEMLALLSGCLLWLVRISLPAAALLSPASHASLPAAVRSHLRFTHSLYSSALSSYFSTRHSRLNTRFFTELVSAAPAIAWLSAPAIAALAVSGAATAFLRCDCFILLSQLMGRKEMLGEDGQQPAMEEVTRAVAEALEAMLRQAAMTEEERAKAKVDEQRQRQQRQQEEEVKEEEAAAPDATKLSKAERGKLKQKEKKKRRRERERLQRAAASSSTAAAGAAASSQAEHRAVIHRLKTALKAATAVAAQSRRLSLSARLLTPRVLQALGSLRQADVAELRGAMHNLLTVGGEEELDVMKAAKAAEDDKKKRRAEERRREERDAEKAARNADSKRRKEATLQPLNGPRANRHSDEKEQEMKKTTAKGKETAAVKHEEEREGEGAGQPEGAAGRAAARKRQRTVAATVDGERKSSTATKPKTVTSSATTQVKRKNEKEAGQDKKRAAARTASSTNTPPSAAVGQKRKREEKVAATAAVDAKAAGGAPRAVRKGEQEGPRDGRRGGGGERGR